MPVITRDQVIRPNCWRERQAAWSSNNSINSLSSLSISAFVYLPPLRTLSLSDSQDGYSRRSIQSAHVREGEFLGQWPDGAVYSSYPVS